MDLELWKELCAFYYPKVMFMLQVIQTIWIGTLLFRSNEEIRQKKKHHSGDPND